MLSKEMVEVKVEEAAAASSLSSDSGDARGDIARMLKQLIVGPRGKRVLIRVLL
jgi:hypothetical protein